MPDSSSNNYLDSQRALADQCRRLKPRHPTFALFFRLGTSYQTFGEDAELLARLAVAHLSFDSEGLAVAEVPVLDCDATIDRISETGHGVIIVDD